MDLSIVIPVYNEEKKISTDLEAALKFFEEQKFEGEIIVVDDGSLDETVRIVQKYVHNYPSAIKLISYQPNKGKGYAVRSGVQNAKGEIIMFADSGNCVPFSESLKGFEILKKDADIAHGSRFLYNSIIVIQRKWYRSLYSFLFRKFINLYAQIPQKLTDTQCGFKMYKHNVAHKLFSQCKTDGFMFDIEIILRAFQLGYSIQEFPIEWTVDHDSRVNLKRTLFRILQELAKIKKQL